MDLRERKRQLRHEMARRCRNVGRDRAEAAAAGAARYLAARGELRDARAVILYASLADELPSLPLFEVARAVGAAVWLPRTRRQGGLEFLPCGRWEDLRPGRYGVLEPREGPARELLAGDLALVPGLAFDRSGWRLGRGGGHWDRSVPEPRPDRLMLVGVGYEFQVLDGLPHDTRDRAMDALLTEAGWRSVETET